MVSMFGVFCTSRTLGIRDTGLAKASILTNVAMSSADRALSQNASAF
jgi:hypothetical protein